jgi:hypothetical protein
MLSCPASVEDLHENRKARKARKARAVNRSVACFMVIC